MLLDGQCQAALVLSREVGRRGKVTHDNECREVSWETRQAVSTLALTRQKSGALGGDWSTPTHLLFRLVGWMWVRRP